VGLLSWLGHICDWELKRRQGVDGGVRHPGDMIYPSEDALSLAAAVIIRAPFAQDDRVATRGVTVLFDAILGVLSGGRRRH
jgi:hypothetical protein